MDDYLLLQGEPVTVYVDRDLRTVHLTYAPGAMEVRIVMDMDEFARLAVDTLRKVRNG